MGFDLIRPGAYAEVRLQNWKCPVEMCGQHEDGAIMQPVCPIHGRLMLPVDPKNRER